MDYVKNVRVEYYWREKMRTNEIEIEIPVLIVHIQLQNILHVDMIFLLHILDHEHERGVEI